MTQPLVWLITGCSSGLGEQFVRSILNRGDKVIATARKIDRIAHLKYLGAAILPLDLTDRESTIADTINHAIDVYGRIDVLVNNAGFIQIGTWEDLSSQALSRQFETNVFGTHKVTTALLPHFRQRKAGSIVFISSLSGWVGHPGCGAYAGSKFALEGMAEALKRELEPLGIKTLLVEPGRFRTKLLSGTNMQAGISKIPEYTELTTTLMKHLVEQDQAQDGDPQKLAEVVIAAVKGEGVFATEAAGFRLPLGRDCYTEMRAKCEEMLRLLERWRPVIESTDIDV